MKLLFLLDLLLDVVLPVVQPPKSVDRLTSSSGGCAAQRTRGVSNGSVDTGREGCASAGAGEVRSSLTLPFMLGRSALGLPAKERAALALPEKLL